MALEGSRYVEWKALDASCVVLLTWGLALLPLYKEGVPSLFSKRVRPREPSFPLNSKGESF
jgi:hypothetical protein